MKRGVWLVAAAAFAGLLLTGTLIYRSHLLALDHERAAVASLRARETDKIVCGRIHALVSTLEGLIRAGGSPAALAKISYYRQHPGEMVTVERRSRDEARRLATTGDCHPSQLPTSRIGGG